MWRHLILNNEIGIAVIYCNFKIYLLHPISKKNAKTKNKYVLNFWYVFSELKFMCLNKIFIHRNLGLSTKTSFSDIVVTKTCQSLMIGIQLLYLDVYFNLELKLKTIIFRIESFIEHFLTPKSIQPKGTCCFLQKYIYMY